MRPENISWLDDLTESQRSLLSAYRDDTDIFRCANRLGFEFLEQPESGYYVYLLLDSLRGSVFYVGKGKKKRLKAHTSSPGNVRRGARISEIERNGGSVLERIFSVHCVESQALKYERWLIGFFRDIHPDLTNVVPGSVDSAERAQILLNEIRSFNDWSATPGFHAIIGNCREPFYWRFLTGLKALSLSDSSLYPKTVLSTKVFGASELSDNDMRLRFIGSQIEEDSRIDRLIAETDGTDVKQHDIRRISVDVKQFLAESIDLVHRKPTWRRIVLDSLKPNRRHEFSKHLDAQGRFHGTAR